MKAFDIFETFDEKYGITFSCPQFVGGKGIGGSFNIIAARVLGLSYPEYLRYARDCYNGTIRGREGYSMIIFDKSSDALMLTQELNKHWKEIEEAINSVSLEENNPSYSIEEIDGHKFQCRI